MSAVLTRGNKRKGDVFWAPGDDWRRKQAGQVILLSQVKGGRIIFFGSGQ